MSDEQSAPVWALSDLARDADLTVNGAEVDVPLYEGLKAKICAWTQAAWLAWLKRYPKAEREKLGWDDEDTERAFFGSEILRHLGPLHDEDGQPIRWSAEVGRDAMLRATRVLDERTGEEVKVYAYDALYQWVKAMSYSDGLFAERSAKN